MPDQPAQKDSRVNGVSLRSKVIGGFIVAVLLTAGLGFLSWHNAQEAASDADWVAHSHEVLNALQLTIQDLEDVDTEGRIYALSGHTPFLQSYTAAKSVLNGDLDSLGSLLADNPQQTRRLAQLRQQIKNKAQASMDLVTARQQKNLSPNLTQLEQGRQLSEEVHISAKLMANEEKRLLANRTERTLAARRLTNSIMLLAVGVGITFLAMAGFAIARQLEINARATAQLDALNGDLERRVEQRTIALKESESRLGGVIQSAMDSIITIDDQQNIVLFNEAAEKMFRCSSSETLGTPITRFIPQRFRGAHSGHVQRFGETGTTNRAMGAMGALRALRADGEEFQIEASISQVVISGRKMFTVILRDVTERKRTEEVLREQAQYLDLVTVLVRDLGGHIVLWNQGAEKLYGFTKKEAVGRICHDVFQTEFPEPLPQIEAKLTATGRWEGELVHRKKDGNQIVVASTWTIYRNSEGQPTRVTEVNSDITYRKQTEQQLAAQAEELAHQAEELARSRTALENQTIMLQSVLDSMAEGLVATDEKGNFIIWNPAAERILGLGATNEDSAKWSEHYGLFLDDLSTPFPTEQLPLVRAIRGESSTAQMFVRNPELPVGVWIEASGGPLRGKDGVITGGVVAFRDITQKKTDDQEIRRLNEELEQRVVQRTAQLAEANKELEAFTYSVSHDLRAPLRHMAGFSGILLEEYGPSLDEQAKKYLHRIQEATVRMGRLVDELLTLARVGRQAPNLQVTGLDSIVHEVISILEPDVAGRKINWKISKLPFVECDPTLIKQVFQNLISNALKYSRPRSEAVIEVGQTTADSDTAIFIRDNGVGFSMKYADKLFGVFQRLHRAEDFEGTGVGLATVQRIIKKHNGRIWAEAELDRGATFYFTLGGLSGALSQTEAASVGGQR